MVTYKEPRLLEIASYYRKQCNMRLVLLFVLLTWRCCSDGANILAVFPVPGKSHFVMFEKLLRTLAERGHNVDVATHFPSKQPTQPRYNQLSIEGSFPLFVSNLSINVFDGWAYYDMIYFMTKICSVDACKNAFNTTALQELKNTDKKYDLVVTEIFGSDCMLGFGHHFNAPTISLISSINLPWSGDRVGNPDNPSYIPNYFIPVTSRMSLYERVENTITLLVSKFLYYYYSSDESNLIAKEFFGPTLPPLEELALNTSLILVNSHFSINYAYPTVPNLIEVGGLHITEPKPLSQHFENILDTNTSGIIFLTMGSMILTESFQPDKIQGMFDAFAELPYKVLWKAERARFPPGLRIPDNIHFEKWMPQMDIMCHPNVKLFVSHGGLMGTQEATYCGVPRLGIPLFADQDNNIRAAEAMELAVKVSYDDISKETILGAASKLLYDQKYKNNCKRVALQFKDRPLSALDTAIYWVEYVIRHKGAPQLRSPGADLPWYQYYLMDVIFIILMVCLFVSYVTFTILRLSVHFVYGYKKEKYD